MTIKLMKKEKAAQLKRKKIHMNNAKLIMQKKL